MSETVDMSEITLTVALGYKKLLYKRKIGECVVYVVLVVQMVQVLQAFMWFMWFMLFMLFRWFMWFR